MEEVKVNPSTAVIVMFKVYTIKREYGHKLTGIRCYDADDRVVLSCGWFQDSTCTKFELKPSEKITGIEGKWYPTRTHEIGMIPHQGALLYDIQFRIFNFAK